MRRQNGFSSWPWLNLALSLSAGIIAFLILLGSQPESPIARNELSNGLSQWLIPIALLIVCFLVPFCGAWIVRGFSNDRETFLGLDLKNFPRGRHSLETVFPRVLALISVSILGFAWYYAQTAYFSKNSRSELFPEHAIQFAGGLVLVFALFQWTYIYLVRKAALKAGVSTAAVVGIVKKVDGMPELILADGSSRHLNLTYIPDWPTTDVGSRRIAVVLSIEPDGEELLVTKDGECFRRVHST